jgi:hypothetical protein
MGFVKNELTFAVCAPENLYKMTVFRSMRRSWRKVVFAVQNIRKSAKIVGV